MFIVICYFLKYRLKGCCDIFVCLQMWRRQTWVGTANILDKAALAAQLRPGIVITSIFRLSL